LGYLVSFAHASSVHLGGSIRWYFKMTTDPILWVIGGALALVSNVVAVIVGAVLTARNAKRAQLDAATAQVATTKAAEVLEVAKRDAAIALRQAIEASHATDVKLTKIQRTTEDTNSISRTSHKIINGQNLRLLKMNMLFSKRIASDNPDDTDAKSMYEIALADYNAALEAQSD
jgi:hypothetical protein